MSDATGIDMQEGKVAAPVISDILRLLSDVARKFEPEASGVKEWMLARYDNPAIASLIPDLTLMMFRVLAAISVLEPVNGITIARQFAIPKGSVSKAARRLLAKKLIQTEARPDNRKEVLFRLTPLGREISEAHHAFDMHMEKRVIEFLEQYDEAQLGFLASVLRNVVETPFVNSPGSE